MSKSIVIKYGGAKRTIKGIYYGVLNRTKRIVKKGIIGLKGVFWELTRPPSFASSSTVADNTTYVKALAVTGATKNLGFICGGTNSSGSLVALTVNKNNIVNTTTKLESGTNNLRGSGAANSNYMFIFGTGNSSKVSSSASTVSAARVERYANSGSKATTLYTTTSASTTTSPPGTRDINGYAAATTMNDTVYIGGGISADVINNLVDKYDLNCTRQNVSNLSVARGHLSAIAFNDSVVFAGGVTSRNNSSYYLSTTSKVDILDKNGVSTSASSFSLDYSRARINLMATKDYIIFGGGISGTTLYEDSEVYTKNFVRHLTKPTIKIPKRFLMGIISTGEYGMMFGGGDYHGNNAAKNPTNEIYIIDNDLNVSKMDTTLTEARWGMGTFIFNNNIYCYSGATGTGFSSFSTKMEVFKI